METLSSYSSTAMSLSSSWLLGVYIVGRKVVGLELGVFVSQKWRNFDRYFEYKYSVHNVIGVLQEKTGY